MGDTRLWQWPCLSTPTSTLLSQQYYLHIIIPGQQEP